MGEGVYSSGHIFGRLWYLQSPHSYMSFTAVLVTTDDVTSSPPLKIYVHADIPCSTVQSVVCYQDLTLKQLVVLFYVIICPITCFKGTQVC